MTDFQFMIMLLMKLVGSQKGNSPAKHIGIRFEIYA